jgi:hypothetical protein
VIPSRLIFRHIGESSARTGRKGESKYTCEWRHPFNGHKDVNVVLLQS